MFMRCLCPEIYIPAKTVQTQSRFKTGRLHDAFDWRLLVEEFKKG